MGIFPLKRDYEIALLKNEITQSEYHNRLKILDDDLKFIKQNNKRINRHEY